MPLLNSVINWINFKRIYQIQLFREHPEEVQKETLFNLLNKAMYTQWGDKHDFDKIRSVSDFQKAMPIQSYEDIKPFVDRLRDGESDILWPGQVKWFAKSSG
ncbi:MAG: GH3 auxin-responsive promoter family protein, partial [Prolixibacteraceae bacterium]|nr:GH3 auxin-responsive promoter family protein [Prolixibacteraceae bacterium]